MNAFGQLLGRLISSWKAATPTGRWMVALSVGFTLAMMIGVAVWSSRPDYKPLREGLSPVATAEIVSLLQASGIPNEMNYSGTGVLVPTSRWNEANVAIAALDSGTPTESSVNNFLMGNPPGHDTNINMRELALEKSLQTLQAVRSADVHLAIPKRSPFRSQQQPASASVIVEAAPNRVISLEIANSIIHTIARAVEGLDPKNVTLMDSQGGLIGGGHADPASSRREYVAKVEASLALKAQDLLAPVLGPNRSVVRVTAEVDDFLDKITKKQQIHATDKVRITEKITSSDQRGMSPSSFGAAGTASNIPDSTASLASGDQAVSGKMETNETSYDYPRTTEELREIGGQIKRLSISATVDVSLASDGQADPQAAGGVAKTSLSQEQVEGIIKSAVGFNTVRGDQIEVVMAQFSEIPELVADTSVSDTQKWEFYGELAKNSSLALSAVAALVIMMLVLGKVKPIEVNPQQDAKQSAVLASLASHVDGNPEAVSKILTAWINANDADTPQQKAA